MAGIPLNTFRTVTDVVKYMDPAWPNPAYGGNPSPYFVYQAPPGTTGIVLYAQVANADPGNNYTMSSWHYRPSTNVWTLIVQNYPVPIADAAVFLAGKMVLQTSDQLYVSGNDTSNTYLQLLASLLESANQ